MKIALRAGVGKNVINLVQCLSRVDRNVDRAEAQDREIDDGPFRAILGKQCDPVAGTYSETGQTERDIFHAFDESRRGYVVPLAVGPVVQCISFVMTQNRGEDQTGNG